MNLTNFAKSAIAGMALSGLAVAADIRLSDVLRDGVHFSSDVMVGCAVVRCGEPHSGPAFTSISGSHGQLMSGFTSLAGMYNVQPAPYTGSLRTTSANSSVAVNDTSEPTFVMAGGQVTKVDSGNATAQKAVVLGDNSNPDPIVSPTFNTFSTVIATSNEAAAPPAPLVVSLPDVTVESPAAATNLVISRVPIAALSPSTDTPETTVSAPVSDEVPGPVDSIEGTPSNDGTPDTTSAGGGTMTDIGGEPIGSDTPEPATHFLIGTGLMAAGLLSRRSKVSGKGHAAGMRV